MKLLIFWILAAGLALATDTPELNRTVNGWPEQRPVRRQGPVEPAAFLDAQVELSDLHLGPSPRDEKVDALAALRILYSGASPHGPAASDGSPHSVRPIPESLLIKGQIAVKGNDAYSHPRVYGRVSQFARPFPLLTDGTTVESIFRAWNVPFGGLSPLKEESVQFHQSWLKSLPRSYETYFTIAKTIRMGLKIDGMNVNQIIALMNQVQANLPGGDVESLARFFNQRLKRMEHVIVQNRLDELLEYFTGGNFASKPAVADSFDEILRMRRESARAKPFPQVTSATTIKEICQRWFFGTRDERPLSRATVMTHKKWKELSPGPYRIYQTIARNVQDSLHRKLDYSMRSSAEKIKELEEIMGSLANPTLARLVHYLETSGNGHARLASLKRSATKHNLSDLGGNSHARAAATHILPEKAKETGNSPDKRARKRRAHATMAAPSPTKKAGKREMAHVKYESGRRE